MKPSSNTQKLHITPPSIPSGDFRFGYKVDEDGHKIISLKSLFKRKLQTDDSNLLGPGYYEANDSMLAKHRGGPVPYHMDSSKRSQVELHSPTKLVGPGSYEPPAKIHAALYQIDPNHQSSMFLSNTKRITDPQDEIKKFHSKF